jgi:hypothetical protein
MAGFWGVSGGDLGVDMRRNRWEYLDLTAPDIGYFKARFRVALPLL